MRRVSANFLLLQSERNSKKLRFNREIYEKNYRLKWGYGLKRLTTCAAQRAFPAWRFGWYLVAGGNVSLNKSATHRWRPYINGFKFKRKMWLKKQASAWGASNFLSEINLCREQKNLCFAVEKLRKRQLPIIFKTDTAIASTIPNLSLSARVSRSSALRQTQIIRFGKSIPGRSADARHGFRWLHSLTAKLQTCVRFRRKRNLFFR